MTIQTNEYESLEENDEGKKEKATEEISPPEDTESTECYFPNTENE